MVYLIIFNFLTGLAVEAFILALVTFLAKPKIEIRDDKSAEEHRTWNLTFNIISVIAGVLLASDILYVYFTFIKR